MSIFFRALGILHTHNLGGGGFGGGSGQGLTQAGVAGLRVHPCAAKFFRIKSSWRIFGCQPQTLEGEGGYPPPPPPTVYGRSNTSLEATTLL